MSHKDTIICGAFECRFQDICEFYQKIGIAACSGHPIINPDGECANFLCECCESRPYDHCRKAGE